MKSRSKAVAIGGGIRLANTAAQMDGHRHFAAMGR
jgi:hypothetical protein